MKILIANLGSTSLKYRLFDFSDGREAMLARGGFERVTDHATAIESCLEELKKGGWVKSEKDLAAVGFDACAHPAFAHEPLRRRGIGKGEQQGKVGERQRHDLGQHARERSARRHHGATVYTSCDHRITSTSGRTHSSRTGPEKSSNHAAILPRNGWAIR